MQCWYFTSCWTERRSKLLKNSQMVFQCVCKRVTAVCCWLLLVCVQDSYCCLLLTVTPNESSMYWEMNWITVTQFTVTPNVLSICCMYWELNWITVTQFTVTPNQLSSCCMYWELNWITVQQFTVTPNSRVKLFHVLDLIFSPQTRARHKYKELQYRSRCQWHEPDDASCLFRGWWNRNPT